MADDRHFENGFIGIILAGNHPISVKFGVQTQILVPWTATCWFIKKLWNSKWRTAAMLKTIFWLYLHELLSDWRDIWYVQVEPCSDTRHMTKIAIFENSRLRTAAILKWFHHYISAADHLISMKFGVPLQILVLRTVTWQSIKILQIQNGGRRLCLWAIICRPTDLVTALS